MSIFLEDEEKQEKPKKEIKVKEKAQSSNDLQIKWYPLDLPSCGKLGYPEAIEHRDIMVRDEKILASSTGSTYKKVLNSILKSLLKDNSFFEDMSLIDREYLLILIWATSYSPMKKFDVTCPSCSNEEEIDVDLTQLDIENISDKYESPFELETSNGSLVKLRMFTIGDEEQAEKFIERHKNYDVYSVMMALATDIGKVMPLQQKLKWIEDNLTGKDMSMIRAFHEYFKYGVEDSVEHICSSCGEVARLTIPFSTEFFLPTARRDFETMLRSNKKSGN